MDDENRAAQALFLQEARLLERIDHVHIVKSEAFIHVSSAKQVAVGYCSGGDLQTLLNGHRKKG